MSLTVNAKTYTADSIAPDAVGYAGAANTTSVKDVITLRRSKPKPSAVSSGIGRTFAKAVRTVTLTGALAPTGEVAADFNVILPVGTAGADVDTLLNDLGAFIASASFKAHVKAQQINF